MNVFLVIAGESYCGSMPIHLFKRKSDAQNFIDRCEKFDADFHNLDFGDDHSKRYGYYKSHPCGDEYDWDYYTITEMTIEE